MSAYINPLTILSLDNVDKETIKKARRRKLAEFDLSDDGLVDFNGRKLTKNDFLQATELLDTEQNIRFLRQLKDDLPLLDNFLATGDLAFFKNYKDSAYFSDSEFIAFLSAYFLQQYSPALLKAYKDKNKSMLSQLLRPTVFVDKRVFDKAYLSLSQVLTQQAKELEAIIGRVKESKSPYNKKNLQLIEITVGEIVIVDNLNILPNYFQSQRNAIASAIEQIAVAVFNKYELFPTSMALLAICAQLKIDGTALDTLQKSKKTLEEMQQSYEEKRAFMEMLEQIAAEREAARLKAEREQKATQEREVARLKAEREQKATQEREAARLKAEREQKATQEREAARLKAEHEQKATQERDKAEHEQKATQEREAAKPNLIKRLGGDTKNRYSISFAKVLFVIVAVAGIIWWNMPQNNNNSQYNTIADNNLENEKLAKQKQDLEVENKRLKLQLAEKEKSNQEAQKSQNSTIANTNIDADIIYIAWVDAVRMRAVPNLESEAIYRIPEGARVEFLNETTSFSVEVELRGQKINEPFIKVYDPAANIEGWVFRGALKKASEASDIKSYQTIIPNKPDLGIEMLFVEGGEYSMGCKNCMSYHISQPHDVRVSNFYIAKYEVTQAQWRSVIGDNPSHFKNCDKCPVENVSWNDVQKFLITLNEKTGKKYRLPTEAEWEFAARGGNKSKGYTYSGSNNDESIGWIGYQHDRSQKIGLKNSNELGLYDMTGNVREYCFDLYDPNYYVYGEKTNPIGPKEGGSRIIRGGAWSQTTSAGTVGYREYLSPNAKDFYTGFRLAHAP